jgi:DNA modification methylase
MEYRALDSLKKHPKNPRTIKDDSFKKLVKSIDENPDYFEARPIILSDRTGELIILAGNQRYAAAKEIGIKNVPTVLMPAMTEEKEKEIMIRDNISNGDWDYDMLSADWDSSDLQDWGLDVPDWGEETEGLTDPDDTPEVEEEAITQLGDIWILGDHRVMCGDSTDLPTVEKLMDGQKADMVFTSPPYTDQREYNIGSFNWNATMFGVNDSIMNTLNIDAHVLVNLGCSYKNGSVDFYWQDWLNDFKEKKTDLYGMYIWDKGFAMCGEYHGRLALSHEYVFHFKIGNPDINKWIEKKNISDSPSRTFRNKDGSTKKATSPEKFKNTLKIPDSVIRIQKETDSKSESAKHPARFPVELPEFVIKTWTHENHILFEPFLGSGSTLIACEKTNRKCFGMELSEQYCDVIVKRWQEYTGNEATLEATGETFNSKVK